MCNASISSIPSKQCDLQTFLFDSYCASKSTANVFNLVLITGNNHAMARDAFAPLQFIRIIFQNIIDCKQSIFWSEPLPFGKSFSSTVEYCF